MRGAATPFTLFHRHNDALRSQLPGVLDGLPDNIHEARVATRRLRELLPLVGERNRRGGIDDLCSRFKQIGRSLGRVRDSDVRIALLASLEARIPHAAPSLVVERQRQERIRLERVRKLIKRLERLEAVRLIDSLDASGRWARRMAWGIAKGPLWLRTLQRVVALRARAAAGAIEHATGVYFPNRLHKARIAIKQLRYALEIAQETGAIGQDDVMRDLKKGQELLGDLHDRQALSDELTSASSEAHEADTVQQLGLVIQVIDAECRALHGRYLERRARLLEICRAFEPAARRSIVRPSFVTLGALAVSSGLYAVAHRRRLGPAHGD